MNFSEAFVLHVELICPDEAAAVRVLTGLQRCANATRNAGPGVPVYLFHRSEVLTREARVGAAASRPVGLEYFELYLDGDAFWRHADSNEFLKGFREVTNPVDRVTRDVFVFGNPGCDVTTTDVWARLQARPPTQVHAQLFEHKRARGATAEYLSLFIQGDADSTALQAIVHDDAWISCLVFSHPARPNVTRLLGVRALRPLPDVDAWSAFLQRARAVDGTSVASSSAILGEFLRERLGPSINLLGKGFSGYALHPNAGTYAVAPAKQPIQPIVRE